MSMFAPFPWDMMNACDTPVLDVMFVLRISIDGVDGAVSKERASATYSTMSLFSIVEPFSLAVPPLRTLNIVIGEFPAVFDATVIPVNSMDASLPSTSNVIYRWMNRLEEKVQFLKCRRSLNYLRQPEQCLIFELCSFPQPQKMSEQMSEILSRIRSQ